MQTIPIGARVTLIPTRRYTREGDDEYWTGIVEDTDESTSKQLLLVSFGQEGGMWWNAAKVRVVD